MFSIWPKMSLKICLYFFFFFLFNKIIKYFPWPENIVCISEIAILWYCIVIWIYAFQIWIGRRLLNYGLVFVFFTLIDMFYQTIDCDIYWLNLFRWLFDYNAGVKRKGVHFPFELIQQICLLPCSCYCSTLKFTVHNFQEFDCFSAASSVSFSKEKYFHQLL